MNSLSSSSSFILSPISFQNPNFTISLNYFKFTTHTPKFTLRFRFHFQKPRQFRLNYKFPKSDFSVGESAQVSDTDEDDEDDEEAADEYEPVAEFSDGDSDDEVESDENVVLESDDKTSKFEEFKWQRIERIRNDVREYGDGLIDADELASVYNFRIDKFQVVFYMLIYTFIFYFIFSVIAFIYQ